MKNLIIPALRTFLVGFAVFSTLLFLAAWTLDYWQAWVFIAVFMASSNAIGVYLSLKDPELLERRKQAGPWAEPRMAQQIIISFVIIGFFGLIVFSAFDHRFGWSRIPPSVSLAGDVLVALGFFIDFLVLRENSYGASNIRTFEGQRVISTGPYAFVRHPMYAGVLIMMIGIPLALGSWWGLAVLALNLPMLIWRILDEERLLKKELPGYMEYTQNIRYRLVPFVW
ncbi:MAG TPA: isoprenylcysteine carboxylmethyltransferase family protein [Blastocatellia bacterium]|nr:isoprenylcysteine carboxylmethyltransferase family protein [Blastocatellia bacterium]